MRKNTIILLLLLPYLNTEAQNPILPAGNYLADPSAKVWDDGRLYLYGSRDVSTEYYCSHDHFVVSTDDMVNWSIHNDAFHSRGAKDQVPYNDKTLYAPDCQYFDGTYFLYYSQPYEEAPEGVAVSSSPTGPFQSGKAIDLKGYNQIDPSVFVDDDGQAYYLWGQFTLKMARLNKDRMSIDGESLKDSLLTESAHYFHEGAYLTKRKDTYYLVYADISRAGRPTSLGYATSKSVFGPYEYGGVIIDNDHCDGEVWNNHGSIVEFKNQWYVFYHRSSHGSNMMRRSCVEPIYFKPDGSIPEVEMTSQGAGSPLSAFESIEAERACLLYGNAFFRLGDGQDEELAGIHDGDQAAYRYIDFGDGEATKIELNVTPGDSAGSIIVHVDKPWHRKIAEIEIPARRGQEKRITVSAQLEDVSGVHELWLTLQGEKAPGYTIDSFVFRQ